MSSFEITGLPVDELDTFFAGAHPDPFRILGPHRVGDDLVIRVFRPDAKEASIVVSGQDEDVVASAFGIAGWVLAGIGLAYFAIDWRSMPRSAVRMPPLAPLAMIWPIMLPISRPPPAL